MSVLSLPSAPAGIEADRAKEQEGLLALYRHKLLGRTPRESLTRVLSKGECHDLPSPVLGYVLGSRRVGYRRHNCGC